MEPGPFDGESRKLVAKKNQVNGLVNVRLWLSPSIKLTANTSENRPSQNEPSIFRRWLLVSGRLLLKSMTIRRSKRMCDTYPQTYMISKIIANANVNVMHFYCYFFDQ